MGIFSAKHNKNFIVIDIGGNAVSVGLIVNTSPKTCPQITTSVSTPIEYGSPVSMPYYERSLTRGLQNTLTSIQKKTGQLSGKFICLLPSLLSHNTVLRIQYDDPKGFTVTPKIVNNIVEKNIREWLRSEIFSSIKCRLLESVILNISVNGYSIKDPYNKKATRLELSVYASVAETKILDRLDSLLSNYNGGKKVTYITSALAHYRVIADLFPYQTDFLFVDPTGELCDLLYVSNGILRGHISFPVGGSTVLRHLVDSTGTVKSEAGSTIALYVANSLPVTINSKTTKSLESLQNTWSKQMTLALKEASNYGAIPQQVFVLDDDPAARLYAKWINEVGFQDLRLGGGKLTAILLGRSQLENLCPGPENLPYQLGLALGGLFARNLGE